MITEIYWQIIILITLIFFSAFFSSSETALMSLSKFRIRHMKEEKIKGIDLVAELINDSNKLLSAILVGNNIVNIGASALATSISIKYFGSSGVTIATIAMTFIVLIFAEITPKSLAVQNSEKIALKVSRTIKLIIIILNPIIIVVNHLTNFLISLLGGNKYKENVLITEKELKTMIDVSHEEGILEMNEKQMIHNIFEFADTQVKNIMIPRTATCFINADLNYGEVVKKFKEKSYSRMPVYKDSIDNIIGVLNIKSLIYYKEQYPFNISHYTKEPFFTYEFISTMKLFEQMRESRVTMAVVLDEYGGTAGIVTLEDLVEEIMGEIEDEYDTQTEVIKRINNYEYIVDGKTSLETIRDVIKINIESNDFDTIGGFIIGELGSLPPKEYTFEYNNVKFIVLDVSKNTIKKLNIIIKDI